MSKLEDNMMQMFLSQIFQNQKLILVLLRYQHEIDNLPAEQADGIFQEVSEAIDTSAVFSEILLNEMEK